MTIDHVGQMAHVRSTMRSWLHRALRERRDIDDVLLAAGEAMSNALEHGSPPVSVEMALNDGPPVELRVRVHDLGPWVPRTDPGGRGYGLGIMRQLMTQVDVDTRRGTTLTMRKRVAVDGG